MEHLAINRTDILSTALDIIVSLSDPDMVILFGSRAKGLSNLHSDYDILILKKGIKNQRKLVRKIYLNMIKLGVSIDLLVYDTEKFELEKNYQYK